MSSDVLREFLVGIGYRIDSSSERKFTESVDKATKLVVTLGAALETAALALTASVAKIAQGMERLYYESQRTNASVANIKAFTFAASEMGSSVEEANTSLENFGKALRTNPGYSGLLQSLGVKTRDAAGNARDSAEMMVDLGKNLAAKPYYVAKQYADQFGIDENTLRALERFSEYQDRMAANRAKMGAMGFFPDADAKNAKDSMNSLREIYNTLEMIVQSAAAKFFKDSGTNLTDLNNYLIAHGKEIAATLEAIARAILEVATQLLAWLANPVIKDYLDRFTKWLAEDKNAMNDLKIAAEAFFAVWVGAKFLGMMSSIALLRAALGGGGAGAAAGLLGVLGAIGAAGLLATSLLWGEGHGQGAVTKEAADAQRRANGGNQPLPTPDTRNLWQRFAPKILGGQDKPSPYGDLSGNRLGAAGSQSAGGASLTDLIANEARAAGIDPRIMEGIRAGESGHGSRYDVKDDAIESSWGPYQLNRRRGLGATFEKETGLDVRDPSTIPAQTRWVAQYIAKGGSLGAWMGYHGPRNADPRWGNSGYVPPETKVAADTPAAPSAGDKMAAGLKSIGNAVIGHAQAATDAIAKSPFGDLSGNRLGGNLPAFATQPLGSPLNNSWQQSSTNISAPQTVNINATLSGEPNDNALAMGRIQHRANADLVRNLQNIGP